MPQLTKCEGYFNPAYPIAVSVEYMLLYDKAAQRWSRSHVGSQILLCWSHKSMQWRVIYYTYMPATGDQIVTDVV